MRYVVLFIGCVITGAQSQGATVIPTGSVIAADQSGPECAAYNPDDLLWTDETRIWSWNPDDSPDIPSEHNSWYNAVTDCKRVLGGSHMITSASGGMLALVRVEDKHVEYYGYLGGNLHSVEILPDTNLAAISSGGLLNGRSCGRWAGTSSGNTPIISTGRIRD
jgi:hypothetical protein